MIADCGAHGREQRVALHPRFEVPLRPERPAPRVGFAFRGRRNQRCWPVRAGIGELASAAIARALGVLDTQLATRSWLLGAHFTVADLNVAAVLSPSRSVHLDLLPFPNAGAWLRRSYARPAAIATRKRFEAFVDPPHDRRAE